MSLRDNFTFIINFANMQHILASVLLQMLNTSKCMQ